MRIRLMSQVWKHQLDHSEQAVALTLADHADDEGNNIFPSVAYVAWKTGYEERQVQRIISKLRKRKCLILVHRASQHRANEYKLNLASVPLKPPFRSKARGDKMSPLESRGDIEGGVRGDISAPRGDIAVSPDPSSINHQEESSATKSEFSPQAEAVIRQYVSLLGYKPRYLEADDAEAVEWLASRFTPDQIAAAYKHHKDTEFWRDKPLRFKHLERLVPEFVNVAHAPNPDAVKLRAMGITFG